MALARSRRERGVDYWPGFVDALSTLVARHHLPAVDLRGRAVLPVAGGHRQGHGAAAAQRADRPTDRPALARKHRPRRPRSAARHRALQSVPRPKPNATVCAGSRRRRRCGRGRKARASELASRARSRKAESWRARWRRSKFSTSRSPPCAASSARSKRRWKSPRSATAISQTSIADLGQRLNLALAQRVQELQRYRSDFFGRLRADPRQPAGRTHRRRPLRVPVRGVLRCRPGGAEAGRPRRDRQDRRRALLELEKQIPPDIAWVMRVDGHTDIRPIANVQFPSNWELSSARAIAVVQYMISARHLAATSGRRRLRRVPAARHREDRRGLPPQPQDRAEADRAVK